MLLFGNATAHTVGVSLESFEICLFFCGLCWSCRPTCPRSLNVVGHKTVKDPLNCTVVRATKHLSKRASDPPIEKKKKKKKDSWHLFSKHRYWLKGSWWAAGGLRLFQYGATVWWEKNQAMQTWVEASGSNCWLGFGLWARTVVIGSLA